MKMDEKNYRRHVYWVGKKQKTINQVNGIKTLEIVMSKYGDEYIPFGRFRDWRIIDVYRRPNGRDYLENFASCCNVDVGLYGYIMTPVCIASRWKLKK